MYFTVTMSQPLSAHTDKLAFKSLPSPLYFSQLAPTQVASDARAQRDDLDLKFTFDNFHHRKSSKYFKAFNITSYMEYNKGVPTTQ